MFGGGVAGAVLLFLLGLTGGGWKVFMSLVALLSKPENHPYPELMPNLRGMVHALTGWPQSTDRAHVGACRCRGGGLSDDQGGQLREGLCFRDDGRAVNFHAYIQDPMLLLLAAAILFDGQESAEWSKAIRRNPTNAIGFADRAQTAADRPPSLDPPGGDSRSPRWVSAFPQRSWLDTQASAPAPSPCPTPCQGS